MQSPPPHSVYTLPEMYEEAKILRRTFATVRLVSPSEHRAFRIESSGLAPEGCCHSIWGRAHPCDYCLSRHVLATHGTGMKMEMVDGRAFLVLARFILLEGQAFSLEMVSEVSGFFGFEREGKVLGEISRLQRENSRLMRDQLTGCYSRHYLNEHFRHYVCEAGQRGQELCVALFDMDNFKDINDRYGHATGDDVLKSCCRFWLKFFDVPGRSFVTRYGGDEFVIISLEDDYEDFCYRVVHLADSMRRTIVLHDGGTVPFSFTMGCAALGEMGSVKESVLWDELFALADARMYHGKNAGRSCIVTGPDKVFHAGRSDASAEVVLPVVDESANASFSI